MCVKEFHRPNFKRNQLSVASQKIVPMRIHILKISLFAFTFAYVLLGCVNQKHEQTGKAGGLGELSVFAAASLTDALTQISRSFESGRNVRVYTNFASSSTLQIQIEKGAPADLFISASPKQMDTLQEKGLIDEPTRGDVLTNSLVMVAPIDNSPQFSEPQELTQAHIRRIAIGEPNSVPAGIYGKEALTRLGIWSDVEPKLIPGADVRAALAYVEWLSASGVGTHCQSAAIWPFGFRCSETLTVSNTKR